MRAYLRSLAPASCLGVFFLAAGCVRSQSKPNDIRIGHVIVDDAFISQSTSALIEGSLAEGCKEFQFDAATQTRCANAFTRLTELLDFKTATSGDDSSFVFLHSQLMKNISSEIGKNYLKALSKEISEVYASRKPLRLWEFTLSHFKGDINTSIAHIASLFQDTLPTEAQIGWLLQTRDGDAATLSEILDGFDDLEQQKLIKYYPQNVESSRSAFYHFYIPMYFAHEMKFHYTKKDMAFLTAFLFNARYEFRQIFESANPQEKTNYDVKGGFARRKALIDDLVAHLRGPILPFDATKETDNLEDLYLGYAGAKIGVGDILNKEDSEAFKKTFASNPMAFIKSTFSKVN
jgi:hypothetical protein